MLSLPILASLVVLISSSIGASFERSLWSDDVIDECIFSPDLCRDDQWNRTMVNLDKSLQEKTSTFDLIGVVSNVPLILSVHYPFKLSASHQKYIWEFWKSILNRAHLQGSSITGIRQLFDKIRHHNSMLNIPMDISIWNEFMRVIYQLRPYDGRDFLQK